MGSLRVRHDWATSLSLSCIGEGNGNLLQCSCLENPMDGGDWWAAVYEVAQSRTRMKRLNSSSSSRFHLLRQVHMVKLELVWSGWSLYISQSITSQSRAAKHFCHAPGMFESEINQDTPTQKSFCAWGLGWISWLTNSLVPVLWIWFFSFINKI